MPTITQEVIQTLPSTGFLRLIQIIGSERASQKKAGTTRKSVIGFVPPIIPISRTQWWKGIRDGIYPKPIKLSARCAVWRVEDIRAIIERQSA